ncbi:MAG: hypothetical protein HS111_36040 [Kofleriaceae bacterium]|nr:hypothetical protein [Kofleriaceae bacterium]
MLISARSGDAPVDRRGVGELRVGVDVREQLLAGYLVRGPRELSADAERELERNGRSITVVAGDARRVGAPGLGRGRGDRGGAGALRRRSERDRAARRVAPAVVRWRWLGRLGHAEAVALMAATRERVLAGDDDAQELLLCEHPPTA